jgi:Bacterial toxin 23
LDGFGYGLTSYSSSYIEGRDMAQVTGNFSLMAFGAQVRVENDFLAGTGDKFRTNALEFSYGHFVIGSNIYTNDPVGEGQIASKSGQDLNGKTSSGGAWPYGAVYSAPIWVDTKFGNSVDRIGYSDPRSQNLQQNGTHRGGSRSGTFLNFIGAGAPYYNNYDCFKKGFYFYSSFYNPYSLFEK